MVRPSSFKKPDRWEPGGLSGEPLSTAAMRSPATTGNRRSGVEDAQQLSPFH